MPRAIPFEALAFLRGVVGDEGMEGISVTGIDMTPAGPRVRFKVPKPRRQRRDGPQICDREALAEAVSRYVAVRWRGSVEPRTVPAESYLALMEAHPEIYDTPTETADGWHWLLLAIAEWIKEAGVPQGFGPDQIKEKFGTLRFYCHGMDDEGRIDRIVRAAEWLSGAVCETCGAPGRTRSSGYVRTACDAHAVTHRS